MPVPGPARAAALTGIFPFGLHLLTIASLRCRTMRLGRSYRDLPARVELPDVPDSSRAEQVTETPVPM